MKKGFLTGCFMLIFTVGGFSQNIKSILKAIANTKPPEPVQILLVGSTHFGQEGYYKDSPNADLFNEQHQKEIAQLTKQLQRFNPDMVMIERSPEEQASVDSLYTLYKNDKITLEDIGYGRSEQYQFGYRLAKAQRHNQVFGVDYYESVSNRMLTTGDNIEYFQKDLTQFANVGREVDKGFKEGTLSLSAFLLFLNAPEVLDMAYRVIFVTPAKVKNGSFLNPPAQYVDTNFVNPAYIGAEYISIFYERELKIYSNIVTTQLAQKGKRIVVIMGQRHAAGLTKIFEHDHQYKLVKLSTYLK